MSVARATLRALSELNRHYHCSVLISTATQPSSDLLPDIDWKPRELVPSPQALHDRMRRTRVEWRRAGHTPLSDIADEMAENPRSLSIGNLTAHASSSRTGVN
jgi:hypothetical protein